MIRALAILFLVSLVGCQNTDDTDSGSNTLEPVTLEVFNSLRIPAHRVKITLETNGKMNIEVQDRNEEPRLSDRTIGSDDLAQVQSLLQRIKWRHVAGDDVIGLDGTSVRVHYRRVDYSVWTPSDDTRKRRLGEFLKLKEDLFRLAGLNKVGLQH